MKMISRRESLFLVVFGIAALFSARINFSQVLGGPANQTFTVFQFFGPTAASFLGPLLGLMAILASEIANVLLLGKSFTLVEIARLFPMLFAAYYFTRMKKGGNPLGIAIPLGCMALFVLHPVGGQAWLYSLYWLIPVAAVFFPERLFLRSLGATFTAHAIGSVVWLYSFESAPAFWAGLIPVVAYERLLFALGIAVSYVVLNSLLAKLESRFEIRSIRIDKRYVLG